MHGNHPPVQRLQLHLPEEDEVRFRPEDDPAAVAARADLRKDTTLTGFFKACAAMPELMANVLYADAPRTMTWDNGKRTWNVRRRGFQIGRVYFAGPSSGERYYLRRLLYHVPCPTSYEFLRTVEGTTHPTFKAACIALGLLEDDGDLHNFLTQIGDTATARQLRRTFATILCECQPADPLKLWRDHRVHICDDCRYMLIHRGLRADPTEEEVHSLGLQLLGEVLEERGRSLASVYMPEPSIVFDISPESRVIREETSYDQDELRVIVDRAEATANEGQRAALDELLTAVALNDDVPHDSEDVCEAAFFLDGPGGTGKTFVENAIAAILRLHGKIVIMVGSSGICAILLKGGRTGTLTLISARAYTQLGRQLIRGSTSRSSSLPTPR
jgi:ATP-dependent DNA helicase PIF1